MTRRHAAETGIEWRWADVRDMKDIPSSSVDVAFDKGTMDAMIHGSPWNPPHDVLINTLRYIREVSSYFWQLSPCSNVFQGASRTEKRWHLLVRHV